MQSFRNNDSAGSDFQSQIITAFIIHQCHNIYSSLQRVYCSILSMLLLTILMFLIHFVVVEENIG